MFNVQIHAQATSGLAALAARFVDLQPVMDEFGVYMMDSIKKNFDEGGRPNKWAPLKNEEVIPKTGRSRFGKRKQGRARSGGPLVLTGDLRSSVSYRAEHRDLIIGASPMPGVKGPVHQFGTDKAGRNRNITIPARPYLVFQEEDYVVFGQILTDYLTATMPGAPAGERHQVHP